MITVESIVDLKVYHRVIEFKNKINNDLLQEAIKKAGDKQLNLDTVNYTMEPIPGKGKCGCTNRLKVILNVEVL